jgi:hypothetical protein
VIFLRIAASLFRRFVDFPDVRSIYRYSFGFCHSIKKEAAPVESDERRPQASVSSPARDDPSTAARVPSRREVGMRGIHNRAEVSEYAPNRREDRGCQRVLEPGMESMA